MSEFPIPERALAELQERGWKPGDPPPEAPEVRYAPQLEHLDYWARQRGNEEGQLEIPAEVVSRELVNAMQPNPDTTWCRRRGCGHKAALHEGDLCEHPGCDCEGLRL